MKNTSPHILSILVILLLLGWNISYAQKSESNHSLYLLSNLESLSADAPEIDAIENQIKSEIYDFTILINGDFVDKNGVGVKPKQDDLDKVDRLLRMAGEKGRLIFIPGDREWDNGGKKGLKKVKALEKYLESKKGKGTILFPQKGCLGPEIIDIGDNLRIAAINTQWFVEDDIGPREEEAECGLLNETEFWAEMGDVLDDADNRNLIIAGHHPVLSYGQYAGYKLTAQHFKPPIIGSMIASYHQNVGGRRDLNQVNLKRYSREMLKLTQRFEGSIFVSGHEYDTQVLGLDNTYYINSGAIAKSKPVGRGLGTIYRQKEPGFSKLIFEDDGTVRFHAFQISDRKDIKSTYEKILFESPCTEKENSGIKNLLYQPCIDEFSTLENETALPSSGKAVAGLQYKAGFFKQLILGKHYRSTWIKPLNNIPYLDLDTAFGGLRAYSRGGGAQTTSVKFKSEDGQTFAFRSINKTPTQRMDKDLKPGVYGKITQDKTSHQHPYSSTILGSLMDRLDIPHSRPKLYLMPDSPKLGPFRAEFGGMFGTLEVKPKGKKKGRQAFEDANKVVSTNEMYRKMLDDNDHVVDVDKFVTARLFDIWISDWDRHVNNYKWLVFKDGKTRTYKPFPKDRDKALSLYQGMYYFIEQFHIQKDKASFRKHYSNLKYLNYKNKTMDRWLANSYTYEDWMKAVDHFVNLMSDEAIEEAISNLPLETQDLVRKRMTRIFKIRRASLKKEIQKYYKKLAKQIDLVGSNSRELFELERKENGDVHACVFKVNKKGEKGKKLYDRLIKKSETKEIILHGLGKKDRFVITGTTNKSILIRVIGGKGADIVEDLSKVRGLRKMTKVYDKRGKDELNLNTEAKKLNTPEILTFQSQEFFNYNYLKVLPNLSYNADDGFNIGLSGSYLQQGFNKPGFGKRYTFNGSFTTRGNYNLGFGVQFREAVHKWDLITGFSLASQDKSFRNYYGLSNESVLDEDLRRKGFYTNETSSIKAHLGLSRNFWNKSNFSITGHFDFRDIDPDAEDGQEETIYDDVPFFNGQDETLLFGPRLNLNLDLRNSGLFPTKGMQIKVQNFTFFNTADDFGTGGRLESELSAFFTAGIKMPVTLAMRSGYIGTYGDVPFYYKAYLGQQGNHRGFLKNRFGGDHVAYLNTDLRFHFGKTVTPIIPIKYGIFGLFDVGRTWVEGESSEQLHYAYGGGIYLVPYVDSFNLTFTAAQSDQNDFLFSFKIGFFVR